MVAVCSLGVCLSGHWAVIGHSVAHPSIAAPPSALLVFTLAFLSFLLLMLFLLLPCNPNPK